MHDKIEIYTDGSCLGNPGPGGWGVLIVNPENLPRKSISSTKSNFKESKSSAATDISFSGCEPHSTNNRMEMMAIIKALEWLRENLNKGQLASMRITIYSDSNLLMGTLNQGWKRKANTDLWAQIDKLRAWLNIEWVWVKAHATNKKNNQVDKLALAAATKAKNALPKEDY